MSKFRTLFQRTFLAVTVGAPSFFALGCYQSLVSGLEISRIEISRIEISRIEISRIEISRIEIPRQ